MYMTLLNGVEPNRTLIISQLEHLFCGTFLFFCHSTFQVIPEDLDQHGK